MIPPKLRAEMAEDNFYNHCCLTGIHKNREKIDWHHNFNYAGKNLNEKWCILPVRLSIHFQHQGLTPEVKERLDWIMLNRSDEKTLIKYSKAIDLIKKRDKLNNKFSKLQFIKREKFMSEDKKEVKKTKFKKCNKCKRNTSLMICECGNPVFKQK